MAKILVAGLNPAWQQVFRLPAFHAGGVSRAEEFWSLGSGKGLNAAKILARLGHEVSLLQVLAGENGRRVRAACDAFGVRSLEVWTRGETRACVTVLRPGAADEIIAPFRVEDASVGDALLARVAPEDRYDALLVCGSVPPGVDADVPGKIAARLRAPLLLWDSVAGLSPEVASLVSWIKVNRAEYDALDPAARDGRPALVTRAAGAEILRHPEAGVARVPSIEAPLNPIGAGDTASALFADGLLRGLSARAAAARALAAASASCLHPLPAEWDAKDAERLEKEVAWSDQGWP